jgi:SAM-dependent methyltransferase
MVRIGVIERSLPAAPARVLDAGCGDGTLAGGLREKGYAVTVIGISLASPIGAGEGVVAMAGVSLRMLADRSGLTGYLSQVLARPEFGRCMTVAGCSGPNATPDPARMALYRDQRIDETPG